MVRAGLHELSRQELVRPARISSVRDEVEYAFWHALVRDVAYLRALARPAVGRRGRRAARRSAGECARGDMNLRPRREPE
jgi:hypothetical protein